MITCLHCRMQFTENEKTPIVGLSEEEKDAHLIAKLGKHLELAHRTEMGTVAAVIGLMGTVTILCQFGGPSERLKRARTQGCAQVSQIVRRVLLDSDLQHQIRRHDAIELTGPVSRSWSDDEVLNVLRQMREWLYYSDVVAEMQKKPAAAQD